MFFEKVIDNEKWAIDRPYDKRKNILMREIELTQGHKAIVDTDDFDRVSAWSWSIIKPSGHIYAGARINYKYTYLHRFILGDPPFKRATVDHINGDKLDNRKSNLRWATQCQNNLNTAKKKFTRKLSSKYKGVYFCKQTEKWRVRVSHAGNIVEGGRHTNEIDAAKKYNEIALAIHGAFASINVF